MHYLTPVFISMDPKDEPLKLRGFVTKYHDRLIALTGKDVGKVSAVVYSHLQELESSNGACACVCCPIVLGAGQSYNAVTMSLPACHVQLLSWSIPTHVIAFTLTCLQNHCQCA